MTGITETFIAIFSGGTFATMLYLSYRVGHMQGCIAKILTTCEYLNHRTTALEGMFARYFMGGAIMSTPGKERTEEKDEPLVIEGEIPLPKALHAITKSIKVKLYLKDKGLQTLAAIAGGILIGLGIATWPW